MPKARAVVLSLCVFVRTIDAGAQTSESLRATVEALSHDSTAGRQTPSAELDKAARYIEQRFRQAGARPLGDDGTFFQRYPVVETVLSQDSARFTLGSTLPFFFGRDFFYAGGAGRQPHGILRGPLVIVTGAVNSETAANLDVRNKIVVFLSRLSARGAPEDFRSAFALGGAGARAVILPGGRPDSLWKRLSTDRAELMPSAETAWPLWFEANRDSNSVPFRPVLELWRGRWQRFVDAAAIDTSGLRNANGQPKATPLAQIASLNFARKIEGVSLPPNVVGLLSGSDAMLKHEYVVLTAHFDGLGLARGRPPGPQSVLNGADDNASGVAAVIEVARAIASSRPKRSVILVAFSGEENGLWGSDFFAAHTPVPRSSIIANINLDMIGRPGGDTVFVTGLDASPIGDVAAAAIRRNRGHGLTIAREAVLEARFPGQRADERSDHASFRHRGINAILFFTGWHSDYHETTDDAAKVDYAGLKRVTDLVRDVTLEIANAPQSSNSR